ncbi:MAG TPA: hypothetical protein EYP17_06335, partial [Candidatus Latescibacteria bacterium]|nr:hypothetical protein [Candidatus Latescibacterota bacterium]
MREKESRGSLTRREFLKGVAGGAASLALLGLGIGGGRTLGQEGMISIGTLDRGTTFDPADCMQILSWKINDDLFDGLTVMDPETREVLPQLATDWTISADKKTYTFKLREGALFQDGTPFDAEALKFSLQRAATIGGSAAFFIKLYIDADRIRVIDPFTIEIPLKAPQADFLQMITIPVYAPVSPASYTMEEFRPASPVGTGPYRLTLWEKGTLIKLERFAEYWDPARVKNDGCYWRIFTTPTPLKILFLNREVDMAWRELSLEDMVEVTQDPNVGTSEGLGQIKYLVINSDFPPFDKKEVRKAIAAAINRVELSQTIYLGLEPPLYSLIPERLADVHQPVFKEMYGDGNIDLAQNLLRDAGFSKDNPLKMDLWYTPAHYGGEEADAALMIKNQLERTEMIQVELKSREWSTYSLMSRKAELGPVYLLGWGAAYATPDWYTTPFLSPTGTLGRRTGAKFQE